MRRSVHPSRIDGSVVAPPSKSVMLRAAAAALLSSDRTTIRNPSLCNDARAALAVIEALGATVRVEPDRVEVEGGLDPRADTLDCGESGLCMRMFTAIAALADREITLTGRGSLLRRPATAIEAPLEALGASGRTRDGLPPVVVRGPLAGGEAVVDGSVSSQFLSGLLLALPNVPADSVLHVEGLASRPYVRLTLGLLERFGVRIEREEFQRFRIPGGQRLRTGEIDVEGDWSAAAFLLVAGAIGGRIRVTGLLPDSAQADRRVLESVEAAGAELTPLEDGVEVARGDLRAFTVDVTDAPDLLPPLSALACHCEGESVLRGVGRLRHKECDRAAAVAFELTALGARVAREDDVLRIEGGPVAGGEGRSHGDHRIAMALAVAALGAGGPVAIDGAEHVAKSYPGFFDDLAAAGGTVR